ncbi:MAG: hypothetical protein CRU78_19555, partial [Candidatus Accumulibacter phosphatis]|nr:hypothetical protein [Candidatus Accumulibacter phosphatis]
HDQLRIIFQAQGILAQDDDTLVAYPCLTEAEIDRSLLGFVGERRVRDGGRYRHWLANRDRLAHGLVDGAAGAEQYGAGKADGAKTKIRRHC